LFAHYAANPFANSRRLMHAALPAIRRGIPGIPDGQGLSRLLGLPGPRVGSAHVRSA